MASVSFAQNTYAGEVLEDLLTYTAQGNDTYKEGLIHIKSGIQYKYTLPSVSLGDIIQDNKPTPTSPTDSKGTYTGRNVHHHLRCDPPLAVSGDLYSHPRGGAGAGRHPG